MARALYRSVHCNVQHPDSAGQKAKTVKTAWAAADVLKLNEASGKAVGATLRDLSGASIYRPSGIGEHNTIVWRDSVMRKIAAGSKTVFKGMDKKNNRVQRGVVWVLFEHKASKKRVLEFQMHQVANRSAYPAIWDGILSDVADEIKRVMNVYDGVPAVISGDMNYGGSINFPGVAETEVSTNSGVDRFFVTAGVASRSDRKITTNSDHPTVACSMEITATSQVNPTAPKPVPPAPPKPVPTTPGVTPSPPTEFDVRRRATWRSEPRWRYFAQRMDGQGNLGTIIHPELPLSDVSIEDVLTGVNGLSGTISPKYASLLAADGRPLLEEWGTAIWAEENGNIYGGGILQNSGFDGPTWSLDCVGLTGYPVKLPYAAEKFFVETDPADIFRHIWDHIQSQRNGNLGLIVDSMKTGLKIGTVLQQEEFDTQEGPVSFESGPYKLAWYQDHDLSENLASLAADNTFDWREEHFWTGDTLNHYLRLGYPKLGTVRDDLRFVIGENIFVLPSVSRNGEDYADESWVLGSGEGVTMLRGIARKNIGRLRRVSVSADSSLRSQTAVNAQANREIAWRYKLEDITEISLIDHPHAPVGSVLPGDEIQIQGETGWIDLDAMYRVISRTIKPRDPQRVTLEIVRTDRIAA